MLKSILIVTTALILLLAISSFVQGEDTTKPASQTETAPAVEEKAVEAAPPMDLTIETQLCTGVKDRMPVDAAESFPVYVENVYLWCKVTGATDSTSIQVAWYHGDQEMATVELPVKSQSWRTWSSKRILPEWTGNWTVRVLDAAGNGLKELTFTIVESASAPEPETPAEPEPAPEPEPEPEAEDTTR